MAIILQDISPHHYHNQWQDNKIEADDYLIIIKEGAMLLLKSEERRSAFPGIVISSGFFPKAKPRIVYLFSIDNERFFLALAED